MKQEEVSCCQIQEWYPKFKSFSIKTAILELPESFIQYLVGDSGTFLLPTSVSNEDAFPNWVNNPEDEEDFQVVEGSEDESEQPQPPPSFPELELKIKDSIELLGGAVFPKLNWSSPKDIAWISPTGTLKCTSFSDIALLLKSSDSMVHDLCHAYDSCSDKTLSRPQYFYLALRKWYASLRPEMEFRCFVRGQQLVGISQREVTAYYPAVLERKDNLKDLIHDFFLENIEGRFKPENYTFDVYVTKDRRVKLIDFNPWGAFTLPLFFTWEELEQNGRLEEGVDFRIVESQHTVRPGLKTAVPYDYIDMSSGSGWDQFLRNADEELQQQMRSSEAGTLKVPFVFLTNGGGLPESKRALELSELLGVNILPSQILQGHSQFRSLLGRYRNELIVATGKGEPALVMREYGFNKVFSLEEYATYFKDIDPVSQYKNWAAMSRIDRSNTLKKLASTSELDAGKVKAAFIVSDPVDWGRDIQVLCDILRSGQDGVGQPALYFAADDLEYQAAFPAKRLGVGAFRIALESIFNRVHHTPLEYTIYGKPKPLVFKNAEAILRQLCSYMNLDVRFNNDQSDYFRALYMIGDNPAVDIKGAKQAGHPWIPVLTRTGMFQEKGNHKEFPADLVVDTVEDAVDYILEKELSSGFMSG